MSSLNPSASSVKLYRETKCEHGYAVEHVQNGFDSRQPPHDPPNHVCPGGSREEVVIDYEAAAKVDVEWMGTNAPRGRILKARAVVDGGFMSDGFRKTFTSEKGH